LTMMKVVSLLSTLLCASANEVFRRSGGESKTSIKSTDGNIIMHIEDGKHIGYKTTSGEVINLDEIPAELRSHADATVECMELGYTQGATSAKTAAVVDYIEKQTENSGIPTSWSNLAAAWTMNTELGPRRVVAPGGGSVVILGGDGFNAVMNKVGFWDPAMASCGFTMEDGSTKESPANLMLAPAKLMSFDGYAGKDDDIATGLYDLKTSLVESSTNVVVACEAPALAQSKKMNVSLHWKLGGETEIPFAGLDGANMLSAESWYTEIAAGSEGGPRVHGAGFVEADIGEYACSYTLEKGAGGSVEKVNSVKFIDAATLECSFPAPKGPIISSFNSHNDIKVSIGILKDGK